MGFWGDLFKEIASEVCTNIIDDIAQEDDDDDEMEQLKQVYARTSLEDIHIFMQNCSEKERMAMESVIADRKKVLDFAKNNYDLFLESTESLSDEYLVKYYQRVRERAESLFGKENHDIMIRCYHDALMNRPGAVAIYLLETRQEMENLSYDELTEITDSTDISDDKMRKKCAHEELLTRDADIDRVLSEIEDLENDEFMEIYDRVRRDKGYVFNSATSSHYDEDEEDYYWRYYGENREDMRKCLETEIKENRGYLISEFIDTYCDDEMEEYSNMSTKKLKELLQNAANADDDEFEYDSFSGEIIECDIISVIMIMAILDNRNAL